MTVRSVYRSPDFLRLWVSQVVSKAGANFVEVGLAVFALSVAHGDLAAYGGILFAGLLPPVVLGWAAGGVVDRWDRRRTMVAGDLIRAAVVLSIPIIGQLWWTFGAVFLVETVGLVYKPSVRALTPETVDAGQIMAANRALWAGAAAVDIPVYLLIGIVVSHAGAASPFLIDAAAFAVAAVTVAQLTHAPAARPDPTPTDPPRRTFGADLRDGFAYHRAEPVVGRLLLLSMVGIIGVAGLNAASAAVIVRLLGRPEGDLGWLLAAVAAGMAGGSWLLGRRGRGEDPRRYRGLVAVGPAGFGGITLGVAVSHRLWLTVPLYALGGACNALYQLPLRTWLQTLVPASMRGRVFAARAMGLGGAAAVASLATGWIVTVAGLPVTLAFLAAFPLAAGGLALWRLPHAPEPAAPTAPGQTGQTGKEGISSV